MYCSSWRAHFLAGIVNSIHPSIQYHMVAMSLDTEQSKLESGFAMYQPCDLGQIAFSMSQFSHLQHRDNNRIYHMVLL